MVQSVENSTIPFETNSDVSDADDQQIPHSLEGAPFRLIGKLFLRHGLRRKGQRGLGTWAKLFAMSAVGFPFRLHEQYSLDRRKAMQSLMQPPLFLIGHWRSGTTHLHNLMTCDQQFGCLTMKHCITADSFLTIPKWIENWIAAQVPQERPVDGVKLGWQAPQEEEFALERLSDLSYNHCYLFPDRAQKIFRHSVLLDDEATRLRWAEEYHMLLQRLSYDQAGRKLCLKNPPNTGRLALLNEMYPEAKFVFIVRHPEHVFRSTRKLWNTVTRMLGLTACDEERLEENFLTFYDLIMKRYLADREAIPPDRLVEIKYEDLDRDPLMTIANVYDQLGLYGFQRVLPRLEQYLGTLSSYTKNSHSLNERDRRTVQERWGFAYDEWNYQERVLQERAA